VLVVLLDASLRTHAPMQKVRILRWRNTGAGRPLCDTGCGDRVRVHGEHAGSPPPPSPLPRAWVGVGGVGAWQRPGAAGRERRGGAKREGER
jgi:hypothetical protein